MVEREWESTDWAQGDTLTATELSNHSSEGHAEGEIFWEIDTNGDPVIKDTTSDTIIMRWDRGSSNWKLENADFDVNSRDILNAVLGTALDASSNDIDNISGIDIGTLKSALDADGNDLTNVGTVDITQINDSSGTAVLGESVASGSVTLSSGAATIDTGVAESTTATFFVALGPDTDSADVAADIRAASAGNYEVDIQETDTSVGNPTVNYDIVRVR